jgi:hypothetical protein
MRVASAVIVAFLMSTFFAVGLISDEKTYTPKNGDEIEVLSLVLRSEIVANKWTKRDLICFSVEQIDPSPKLVKALRQQNLNVCSSAEWPKKFNCGFEVRMQFMSLDTSQSARVHTEVADLREINVGEGDLAVRLRDGEYVLRKIDGKWSISEYAESRSQGTAPTSWHKVEAGAFSLFAPSGWEFHTLQGKDSYEGEFVGDGVVLTFDFGQYSSPLNEAKEPVYVIAHESIGGFPAKIVSPRTPGRGVTGVYFHDVGRSNALCLWGQHLTSAQQELVLKIFETIRFGR